MQVVLLNKHVLEWEELYNNCINFVSVSLQLTLNTWKVAMFEVETVVA